MMYCDKCNSEFPDGMTYCKWCGGTLRAKAVATTQLRKCDSCASPIQPGWEFCNVCGARQAPVFSQEPVSISPLCMRCGAVVPPGVTNCLRCGERFTADYRSEPAGKASAPSQPELSCPACGDALQIGALYCKTCGSPASSGTIDLQVPTAPVNPASPSQPTAPPSVSPDAESTIDFSAMRPTTPPAIITHPESTIDLAGLRQQSTAPPPPQPPTNFGQTEIIHSPQDRTPPEGTMAFKSGRSTDESSGQKTLLSDEPSKSGALETRVERPSLQNIAPPDFSTVSKREELPAGTHDPQGIHLTPTINLNEELAPPTVPPPQLESSTIQIGSGDWLSESFAKEPPIAPPQPPPAPDTFFDTSQDTVINRRESQTPGRPAEWQQAPTIETSSFMPPVTQAQGGETMPPMPPMQHSATPPYGQTAPPQPMPPSPFPPPARAKKGGLPILPIAAAVIGLGIVAFLLYWFVLRAKPTNTNANISQQTNANSSVANANTTVANSNTSTTQTTPAPDGMVMVAAGTYPVGREDGDDIEKPKHDVTLKAFYIDKTEVTNADYKKFILATNHQPPSDWQNGSFPAGKDNFPVVNVTWKDANDYAAWAKKRLPTEEEWEAAARGTDGRKYPWGNSFNPSYANIQTKGIVEVGKFPDGKSPAGALDMIGNVWEWTATKFALYAGNTSSPPDEASKNYRVIRGGAYDGDKKHDASYRGYVEADKTYPKTGFRCVKDAS